MGSQAIKTIRHLLAFGSDGLFIIAVHGQGLGWGTISPADSTGLLTSFASFARLLSPQFQNLKCRHAHFADGGFAQKQFAVTQRDFGNEQGRAVSRL